MNEKIRGRAAGREEMRVERRGLMGLDFYLLDLVGWNFLIENVLIGFCRRLL